MKLRTVARVLRIENLRTHERLQFFSVFSVVKNDFSIISNGYKLVD